MQSLYKTQDKKSHEDSFQKDGKENSCMLYTLHPDIANDLVLRKKLCECVDYIRDNYDMETFTKI